MFSKRNPNETPTERDIRLLRQYKQTDIFLPCLFVLILLIGAALAGIGAMLEDLGRLFR